MNRIVCSVALFFVAISFVHAAAPSGLMTDLLEHTDRVWMDGYPSTVQLHELGQTIERYQVATIFNKKPSFTWIVNDDRQNVKQTAYRILIGTDRAKLEKDEADLWDSGKVDSDASVAVPYGGKQSAGKPLPPKTVIYWKVKTWNNGDEQPFSTVKAFLTAENLVDYKTAVYPLQKTDWKPGEIVEDSDHNRTIFYYDFERAAFGRLRFSAHSLEEGKTITVRFGEAVTEDTVKRINRKPGGTIRYAEYQLTLMKGTHTYTIKFRPDKRNTGAAAIKMPSYIGEVYPFRYVEIEMKTKLPVFNVIRETVHYPFNDFASEFVSEENNILNDVWEMCKYSIKATSFAGIYVDGDRERIPYEADALINQLCHYGVDREYSMARNSHEYLLRHATWPTEWILQSVLMAYYDYLYTGDARSAEAFYADLQAKLLLPLADPETGLISTKTGKQNPELLKSIHFGGKELRDIVDWPHTGILGLGKNEGGEADGFVFKEYNTVVNAYHFEALGQMSRIATILGKTDDAEKYAKLAAKVKKSFNEKFLDASNGRYRDGIGTDHSALHANMFPMAFGLVPETNRQSVMDFIRSRGLACSVYGSQFLMDAIYNGGEPEYGLSLLASDAERSWYNMIRAGSTISMEAWDNKYKPNQDWNHAWGAVPANAIPRHLMGVQPLEPGFRRVRIQPQVGSLKHVSATVPTIRGPIKMTIDDKVFDITIPANMEAEIVLPGGKTQTVGSGKHLLTLFAP